MRDGPGQLEPLPEISVLERQQNEAREKAMAILTRHAAAMIEREVAIGMGEVTNEEGKSPDFMVQHLALKSLRQQYMGAPKQTIDQKISSQSLAIKATYEIPAERIDPATQPERIELPAAKPALPAARGVQTIEAPQPTPAQAIKKWKQQSVEASLSMALDEYGAPLPKEDK